MNLKVINAHVTLMRIIHQIRRPMYAYVMRIKDLLKVTVDVYVISQEDIPGMVLLVEHSHVINMYQLTVNNV